MDDSPVLLAAQQIEQHCKELQDGLLTGPEFRRRVAVPLAYIKHILGEMEKHAVDLDS